MEYDYGVLWVRRSVEVPADWAGKRLHLELTVDRCEITGLCIFNGKKIGAPLRPMRLRFPPNWSKRPSPDRPVQHQVWRGRHLQRPGQTAAGASRGSAAADFPDGCVEVCASGTRLFADFPQATASLYDGMIAPLVPFTFAARSGIRAKRMSKRLPRSITGRFCRSSSAIGAASGVRAISLSTSCNCELRRAVQRSEPSERTAGAAGVASGGAGCAAYRRGGND